MEIRPDYRQTEIGIIPNDWDVEEIKNIALITTGSKNTQDKVEDGQYPFFVRSQTVERINSFTYDGEAILTAGDGVGTGKVYHYINGKFDIHQRVYKISDFDKKVNGYFFFLYFSNNFLNRIMQMTAKSSVDSVRMDMIANMKIPIPSQTEQSAIASAISDADSLIISLEKQIAKKRNIKQGAMQNLLQAQEGWQVKTLFEITDCLDFLRVPMNESQRVSMNGDYPYCGANGVLDYINDYCIDDEFILIAEDGGYFDEYLTRPIAYKMSGKCWVNNHAHILKAKINIDQDFIYYSIVHKNILRFLASGTRAKLNKSEMYKIEIDIPSNKDEQKTISKILFDMDAEIISLEAKLDKYKMIKQGMMQNLLTGKIRFV